ncbi:DUF3592 domain-containing protein [Enterococcus faecalis]|uniref:DUF3592 domain-containing protein n=1 Tax=Enterococcus faecalis TaxID=1351 RepID=UPI0021DFAC65|nr:DUF3592 domain-containing protein [Enterococcus faecalis]MCU9772801.1 DUF3592 domain-containing protein [Enterococcus faecalis]MCU9792163.1 DUF3592 domain-containing protein [Enterococcus faecalis]HEC4826980.1 hypothetical protein [Enterococcus faecalis]
MQIEKTKDKKLILILSFILFGSFLFLWGSGLLKAGYVSLNYTETEAQITEINRTLEKNEVGHVYRISVEFTNEKDEVIKTSFRETIDIYGSEKFHVGNVILIRYSNWMPFVCISA